MLSFVSSDKYKLEYRVLFSVFKPDNPIPYNWIYLIVFGIVIIVCGSLMVGIVVLIAGILKLIFENMD